VRLPIVALDSLPDAEREATAARLVSAEAVRPFDLARGPLWRACVLRLNATEHVLMLTAHHSIADGWSVGVLLREVVTLAGSLQAGVPSPLPELPVQYADYAAWQREWLKECVLERELRYWRERLADVPTLMLPADRPRPAQQNFHGGRYPLVVDADIVRKLREVARLEGATVFMTLAAAFALWLAERTGQDDIAIGVPIAGRTRAELEGLIGFFVNTLVLRIGVSGNPTFTELLRRVRGTALEAYAHQDVPFERLVAELRPPRDPSRNPLVQVMLVVQNTPTAAFELPGLQLVGAEIAEGPSNIDLTLSVTEVNGTLRGVFAYAVELFDERTIAGWADEFQSVLARLVTEPGQPVRDAASLAPRERLQGRASGEPDEAPRLVPYVAPRTPHESMLAGIWTETLGLTRVGVEDDFFELGGYSMLAVQVVARILHAMGAGISLRQFFEMPTIAALAARLETAKKSASGSRLRASGRAF
jgi:non-ribosomal peptide synthetase component F